MICFAPLWKIHDKTYLSVCLSDKFGTVTLPEYGNECTPATPAAFSLLRSSNKLWLDLVRNFLLLTESVQYAKRRFPRTFRISHLYTSITVPTARWSLYFMSSNYGYHFINSSVV